MKRLFISLLLIGVTLPALAQHHGFRNNHFRHHSHHNHHGHYRGGWVAPLVIGGVVGYAMTRNDPVIIQQPVIVEQPVTVQSQNCTPWTETYSSDGTITRTRTCTN